MGENKVRILSRLPNAKSYIPITREMVEACLSEVNDRDENILDLLEYMDQVSSEENSYDLDLETERRSESSTQSTTVVRAKSF